MPEESVITPHDATAQPHDSFLASGGMCTCTLVRQRGRLVVRKQLLPEYAADERYLQALEKEFELGCVLQHPNIPRYLEWHDDYFLMDYVDGVTLNEWESLHPGYFARKDHARQLIDELLSAVAYLHQHGVLHLDLKPDNILMTRIGGHVKLIDLGYAYQDSYPFTTGGTPHYTAPDPVKTPASDIYSLGVIFDELGIARKSLTARCRRADAAERYQSIDQLSAALLKPRRWWPLAAAMLLLLLGGWAWWAWSGKSPAVEEQALPPPSGMAGGDTAVERSVALSGAVGEVASDADTGSPVTNDAAPQPVVTTEASPQPVVATDDATATTLDAIDPHVIPKTGFRARQMRELALFQPTTDSILTKLIQFVSDAQKPFQLGGIEAYRAAYEPMKNAALDYGRRKAPFWMRIHWMNYTGNPKPYNPCDNYLYQQMRRIDSLFQANIDHYRLNQKYNDHIVKP